MEISVRDFDVFPKVWRSRTGDRKKKVKGEELWWSGGG